MAQTENLFHEIPLDQQINDQTVKGPTEMSRRQVLLNRQQAVNIFEKGENGDSMTLSLTPGRVVTFKNLDFDPQLGGGAISWSGRVQGLEDGSATLVYRSGRILGHVQIGADTFTIKPRKDGVHVISQLDLSKLPDEGPVMVPPKQ